MGTFSIWHWIITLLVWFVLPAIISVPMARKRNREAFVWAVLAFPFSWISVLVLAIVGEYNARARQEFREHPVKSESHEGHNQPGQDSASQTSVLSDSTSFANETSQVL